MAVTDPQRGEGLAGDRLNVSANPILDRSDLDGWDAAALLLLCGLLFAYFPPLYFDGWSPRMALLLMVAPLGIVLLARRCLALDRVSIVLAAALLWSALSALASAAPRSSLLGFAGRDLSVLTIGGSVACFEVGRMAGQRSRRVAPQLVAIGCSVGALVGVAQVVVGVETGPLALLSGRPTGMVTNPVYFGALCGAGALTAMALFAPGNLAWGAPALFICGVATALSGSRVALLATVLAGAAMLVQRRSRQTTAAAALLAASLFFGVLLDRWLGAGRNAADRLAEAGAGGNGRWDAWKFGLEAFADRPVLGYGWGHYRPAVQDRFTLAFVRDNAADELTQPWFDPHNVGINLLVSVGVVGTALFAFFVLLWARRAHGPLVWALIVLSVHWLLQPLSLFTVPLAFLLFALAGRRDPASDPQPSSKLTVGACAVGCLLSLGLVVSDLRLGAAVDSLDGDGAAAASRWFWNDPITADVVARVYSVTGRSDDSLEWRTNATSYQPDRPLWWSARAQAEFDAGMYAEANLSIEEALALQRYNPRSQRVEVLLALYERDEQRLERALNLACALGQSDCDIDAAELIEELEDFDNNASAPAAP